MQRRVLNGRGPVAVVRSSCSRSASRASRAASELASAKNGRAALGAIRSSSEHAVADRLVRATGVIHKAAGEPFVGWLNANGGLLGRPVEWTVYDDESDQAQVTRCTSG